jgi:hypothetical protein
MLGVDVLIENQISPIAKRMKDAGVVDAVFYNESDETVIIYVVV